MITTTRFQTGQAYYIQTALHHVTFTVTRRTATRLTLSDGKTYRIHEMLGEEYIDMNIFSATVSLCASNIVK